MTTANVSQPAGLAAEGMAATEKCGSADRAKWDNLRREIAAGAAEAKAGIFSTRTIAEIAAAVREEAD